MTTFTYTRPSKGVTFFREFSARASKLVDKLRHLQDRAPGFLGRCVHESDDGLTLTVETQWLSVKHEQHFRRTHKKLMAELAVESAKYRKTTGSGIQVG